MTHIGESFFLLKSTVKYMKNMVKAVQKRIKKSPYLRTLYTLVVQVKGTFFFDF